MENMLSLALDSNLKNSVVSSQWFVLSQEWTRVHSSTTDGAWAGRQDVTLTWEGTPLLTHWLHQLDAASPPRRARLPRCWLSEQRPGGMKDVTWMCPEVTMWELKPRPQQWSLWDCFRLRLLPSASLWDWTDGIQDMDSHPGPAGWVGGGTPALHACVWAALCHSPVTLSPDVSAPRKPCSDWLWNHVFPFRELTWLSTWQTQLHRWDRASKSLFLWGTKHVTSVHEAWFKDWVLCHLVYTEKNETKK